MELICHSRGLDVVRPKRGAQTKGAAMTGEEYQRVPKWLWLSIGVFILSAVAGAGSLTTWTLMEVVDHSRRLSVHEERLQNTQDAIAEIKALHKQSTDKLDTILLEMRKP